MTGPGPRPAVTAGARAATRAALLGVPVALVAWPAALAARGLEAKVEGLAVALAAAACGAALATVEAAAARGPRAGPAALRAGAAAWLLLTFIVALALLPQHFARPVRGQLLVRVLERSDSWLQRTLVAAAALLPVAVAVDARARHPAGPARRRASLDAALPVAGLGALAFGPTEEASRSLGMAAGVAAACPASLLLLAGLDRAERRLLGSCVDDERPA